MITEKKPLTAEEILDITPGVRFDGPYGPFVRAMERYAAQHTAALQEENGRLRLQRLKDADDMLTVMQQCNEAVKLLKDERSTIEGKSFEEWNIDRLAFLDKLSSGETKPESCPSFDEFWKEIVCNPDGTLNEDQVKKELQDFFYIMEQVPKVYCHVTGNTLSKLMYSADTVCRAADDYVNRLIEEEKKDWQEDQDEISPWISVEDQLPEIGEMHLIKLGTDTLLIGILMNNGWTAFYSDGQKLVDEVRPVSHWMPLPAPPESLTDKTE